MLDNLTRRLTGILGGLRKKGRLTEDDVNEMLREVRVALLEADVNFKVAKEFIARVKEQAVGEEVFASLTADQTIVKIVRDELVAMLGEETPKFNFGSNPPTVILMCGLQGSGKTTTTAKLALNLKKQGKKPMLAACDTQRPAAIRQLEVLGEQIDVPVFSRIDGTTPVEIAKQALLRCRHLLLDVLIIDTAGRLQIDEDLMAELQAIYTATKPNEVFLVLDSTTGQESVNVAETFHRQVPATGAIFTKLDGDTRGGAILSVRAATGVPVRFFGIGEGVEALETFHPSRVAERIIGMGDVLGIIERAEQAFAGENVEDLQSRLMSGQVDFNFMLESFRMMKKMGPLKNVLKMLPGIGAQIPEEAFDKVNEKDTNRIEAIILSMTPKERSNPDIINGSRRKRIAAGSGTSVEEVNHLVKQFYESRRSMKKLGAMQERHQKRGIRKR
jgi:signal recognition particle subunit SRP54